MTRALPLLLACSVLLCATASPAEDRVATARKQRMGELTRLFSAAGVAWPPEQLYVRAFKHEGELEVWAGPARGPLVKVKTYPFCAASGVPGPKRQQGDLQVPEGFYTLDLFNPWSSYHLSIRVSYPNAADRRRQRPGVPLGGDIFVHGDCVSIGCIAIQDTPIEELYLMTLDTRAKTKRDTPIHIFPRRLTTAGLSELEQEAGLDPDLVAFWRSLQPAYLLFEESHQLPRTRVDEKTGAYVVSPGAPARDARR
ncbi:L,D-transpeptidase family protein [Myxococcus sp. K15C18031901]|uniref:L,D-transpeptidase family protein n=1 Tax=Myxococcus dinghuensis TaxID=2906761 RepID=UPI0020A790BF|nr:L,D-transpeptidase family protein [Myxococcus dinghuensis]MCP3102837.1 L,D-transpeptidase family protein [Myxococcus dinghuensis]